MTHLACDDGSLSKQSITKSHLKLLRMGLFLIAGNGCLDCVARSMLPATLQTCCVAISSNSRFLHLRCLHLH